MARQANRKALITTLWHSSCSCYSLGALWQSTKKMRKADFFFAFALAFWHGSHAVTAMAMLQNQNQQTANTALDRRKFFTHASSCLLFLPIAPEVAAAAAPVTTKDTDSLGAMAKRAFRQKPPKVLRRKLDMNFAVLLMRSSYNSLDQLDCVAMVRWSALGWNSFQTFALIFFVILVVGSISKGLCK